MRRVITTFSLGEEFDRLSALTVPTFASYAALHGYDLFVPCYDYFQKFRSILDDRCASWLKVLLLQELLQVYDEALWLDSDVAVVRFDKDIADDLTAAPMHMAVHKTADGSVPNCGVWHLRKPAAEILGQLWQHNSFRRSEGWWEQAALIHVLGGDPDAAQTATPAGPLWAELPYEWNPHIGDQRRIPETCRFFHATQFPDRFSAILMMRSIANAEAT